MSEWLSPDRVEAAAREKVEELERVSERRSVPSALLRNRWTDSIGLQFGEGDRDTLYVTPVSSHDWHPSSQLQECGLVSWTHWAGRVALLVKEALETTREYPKQIRYGPPRRETDRPVGPWVSYRFEDGLLKEHEFRSAEDLSQLGRGTTQPVEGVEAAPAFGLREIVRLRDLDQDDLIRVAMTGVRVITGGPGVGKTTVALHRISYLLNEQAECLPVQEPRARAGFFEQRTMQVVVWKEHLVRYLERCLSQLGLTDVAVRHVEDWVSRTLRPYVRFGRADGEYRVEPDALSSDLVKKGARDSAGTAWHGLSEHLLRRFMTERDDRGRFRWSLAHRLESALAEIDGEMQRELSGLTETSAPLQRGITNTFTASVAGIETLRDSVLQQLEQAHRRAVDTADTYSKSHDAGNKAKVARSRVDAERIQRAIRVFRGGIERVAKQTAIDVPSVLAEFYQSDLVAEAVSTAMGQSAAKVFAEDARQRYASRRLSEWDRYLLLWVAHIWTRRAKTTVGTPSLPTYCHMVVDEAQYYDPVILRLLVDLAREPVNSMTIVGDLEQKVTTRGGLLTWDDAGLELDDESIARLVVNYRWSREVFEFLRLFHDSVGVQEALRAPRRWSVLGGKTPIVREHASAEQEDRWLIDAIVDARRSQDWSIAVVVPPEQQRQRWDELVRQLGACDVRARWATGEDVRECEEKVIITDHDSVVGLEFEAVLLPSYQAVLGAGVGEVSVDARQMAWVAMTRAKQFLAISHVGKVRVLCQDSFDAYRDMP
jgi:DNA helicase IV